MIYGDMGYKQEKRFDVNEMRKLRRMCVMTMWKNEYIQEAIGVVNIWNSDTKTIGVVWAC